MSRGPGHIEQAIAGVLDAKPDDAFTTEDLCRVVYPHAKQVEKKHRVAVLRAVGRLQRDTLDCLTSKHLGGTCVYFNRTSVQSYAMAWLKAHEYYASADLRIYDHMIKSEAELRAMLKPGGNHHEYVQPGGALWRHVQSWIAELAARRDKDDEKLIKVLTERWEFNCGVYRGLGIDLPPQPPELVRLLRKRKPSPSRQHPRDLPTRKIVTPE